MLGHVPIPRSEVMPRKFQTPEPKGESYETQNQNQGRQALRQPQPHRSLTVVWGMYGVRPTQSTRKLTKGESHETQNQDQGRKALRQPQHDRSLTLKWHVPIPRSEVMPQKYPASEPKGESYEAQNQNQSRKALQQPQHHRSLIDLAMRMIRQRHHPYKDPRPESCGSLLVIRRAKTLLMVALP